VSPYALQWYFDAAGRQSASPVDVCAVGPITGIDAHLVPGYSVSGTVNIAGGGGAAGVCVTAQDAAGDPVNSTKTASAGPFSIANLATGPYELYAGPTCGGTATSPYATQYFEADPGLSSPTKLTLSQNKSGVDFALADQAVVTGRVSAPGTADGCRPRDPLCLQPGRRERGSRPVGRFSHFPGHRWIGRVLLGIGAVAADGVGPGLP
jgi:hypothetical protein